MPVGSKWQELISEWLSMCTQSLTLNNHHSNYFVCKSSCDTAKCPLVISSELSLTTYAALHDIKDKQTQAEAD